VVARSAVSLMLRSVVFILLLAALVSAGSALAQDSPVEEEPSRPPDATATPSGAGLTGAVQDLATLGGPDALLCRPSGQGPFPTVVWAHGRVSDRATFERARSRGWPTLCAGLASRGFLTLFPIRDFEHGVGPANIPYNVSELTQSIEYARGIVDADPSRLAVVGHSRGSLLGLLVGLERRDLRALVLTAPADIPPYFSQAASRVQSLTAPVLLMVEESDEEGGVAAVNVLDRALRDQGKDVRTMVYNRGGGHFLFSRVDYWWDDLVAFLREKLA